LTNAGFPWISDWESIGETIDETWGKENTDLKPVEVMVEKIRKSPIPRLIPLI
jgi:hypothetical protein